MSDKFYKLFRKRNGARVEVEMPQYYPSEDNYYELIKKYSDRGWMQVIISSDMMLYLLKYYFHRRGGRISDFVLLEDDNEFCDEIRDLVEAVSKNREMFSVLLKHLCFLRDENSIEIQKISMNCMTENDEMSFVTIQSNGVVEIDDTAGGEESNIKEIVEQFYEVV